MNNLGLKLAAYKTAFMHFIRNNIKSGQTEIEQAKLNF